MNRCAFLLMGMLLAGASAAPVPLGHPDYYPSPDRPLGWRGDGTGAWPGANVVSDWDAVTGKNIAWKVNTPGAGLCQPIVAGEKVFITADPNLLLCYRVHDGKLLWQVAIDHTLKMAPDDQSQARAEQAYFDGLWKQQQRWRQGFEQLLNGLAVKQGLVAPAASADKAAHEQWSRARNELNGRVRKGRGGNDPHYLPKPDEAQGVELMRLAGDDAKLRALYEALLKEQEEFGWRDLYGNNGTMYDKEKEPFWMARYRAAQEKYDLWFTTGNNWIAWTTYSFATPVTDGRYIYVTTANNAVAAVDYDGRIAWLVWEHVPKGNVGMLHTRYVASPVLHKGKLVVNQNGHLRAYDAATGQKLWGHYNPYQLFLPAMKIAQFPFRPTPEACSPNVTTLKLPGGGDLDVVLDGHHLVCRLDDGQLLSKELPTHHKGNTSITVGDVYLYVTDGDRKPEFCGGALRLRAASRDKVEVEWLWKETERLCGSTTPVFWNGRFFASGAFSHDYRTGEKQPLFGKFPFRDTGPILAGRQLVALHDHGTATVGDLETKKIAMIPNAYVDRRYAEESEFGLINWKTPSGYQQNSAASAQANRLFYRSRGILWCIGDPAQKFPAPAR